MVGYCESNNNPLYNLRFRIYLIIEISTDKLFFIGSFHIGWRILCFFCWHSLSLKINFIGSCFNSYDNNRIDYICSQNRFRYYCSRLLTLYVILRINWNRICLTICIEHNIGNYWVYYWSNALWPLSCLWHSINVGF